MTPADSFSQLSNADCQIESTADLSSASNASVTVRAPMVQETSTVAVLSICTTGTVTYNSDRLNEQSYHESSCPSSTHRDESSVGRIVDDSFSEGSTHGGSNPSAANSILKTSISNRGSVLQTNQDRSLYSVNTCSSASCSSILHAGNLLDNQFSTPHTPDEKQRRRRSRQKRSRVVYSPHSESPGPPSSHRFLNGNKSSRSNRSIPKKGNGGTEVSDAACGANSTRRSNFKLVEIRLHPNNPLKVAIDSGKSEGSSLAGYTNGGRFIYQGSYWTDLQVDVSFISKYNQQEVEESGNYIIAAVLGVKNEGPVTLYRIYYYNYPLNSWGKEWWQPLTVNEQDSKDGYALWFFNERNKIMPSFITALKKKYGDIFYSKFTEFDQREDFERVGEKLTPRQRYNLELRDIETEINFFLESTGQAPLYIENWTVTHAALSFEYLLDLAYQTGLLERLEGLSTNHTNSCTCENECGPGCPCNPLYKSKKIRRGTNIYTCGVGCKCSEHCAYRTVHKKRMHPVVLFYTGKEKGWGLFAAKDIADKTFMGLYTGIATLDDQNAELNPYDFTLKAYDADSQLSFEFCIDANASGNETSCDPKCRNIIY